MQGLAVCLCALALVPGATGREAAITDITGANAGRGRSGCETARHIPHSVLRAA